MSQLNIFARNLTFHSAYNKRMIQLQKKLLHKLSSCLKNNQWIRVSTSKIDIELNRKHILDLKNTLSFKPHGLWFSKGD